MADGVTAPSSLSSSAKTRPTTLNFITGNPGKVRETAWVLDDTVRLECRADVHVDEIQGTIEEIAREKCRHAARVVGGPVLTEDTALEFRALNGLPGPYIKHFLAALGHAGINNLLSAYEDKTIFSVCTFAYCAGPDSDVILFQGRTQGKLVPARGPTNFGWDACFEYATGKTYAEMEKTEKHSISHRGKALAKLKDWLAGGEAEVL